jgi:hypothetical protein
MGRGREIMEKEELFSLSGGKMFEMGGDWEGKKRIIKKGKGPV